MRTPSLNFEMAESFEENVRVVVRCRPLSDENEVGQEIAVDVSNVITRNTENCQ